MKSYVLNTSTTLKGATDLMLEKSRLDKMDAIFYRWEQEVDWLRARLDELDVDLKEIAPRE